MMAQNNWRKTRRLELSGFAEPTPVMRRVPPQVSEAVGSLFSGIEAGALFSAGAGYAAFSGIRRKQA